MLSALEKLRLLKEQRKKERLEREELERKEIEVLERLLAEEEQCLRDRRAVAALFIVERWEEAIARPRPSAETDPEHEVRRQEKKRPRDREDARQSKKPRIWADCDGCERAGVTCTPPENGSNATSCERCRQKKTPCRVSAQARRKQSAETEAQSVLNTAIVKIIGRLDGIVEESRRHHAVVERLLRELVEKRKNNEGTRARGEKVAGPSGRDIEDYLLYITSGSGNETSLVADDTRNTLRVG